MIMRTPHTPSCARAVKRLEDLRRFDEDLGRVSDLLKPAEIAIDEAAGELRDYLGGLEADPSRLEEVEARLAVIDKLKRKYGATVAEILQFLNRGQCEYGGRGKCVRASGWHREETAAKRRDTKRFRETCRLGGIVQPKS